MRLVFGIIWFFYKFFYKEFHLFLFTTAFQHLFRPFFSPGRVERSFGFKGSKKIQGPFHIFAIWGNILTKIAGRPHVPFRFGKYHPWVIRSYFKSFLVQLHIFWGKRHPVSNTIKSNPCCIDKGFLNQDFWARIRAARGG